MKKIVLEFAPNGRARVQTHGYKGQGCVEATRALETALGEVVDRSPTAEAHEVEWTVPPKVRLG